MKEKTKYEFKNCRK